MVKKSSGAPLLDFQHPFLRPLWRRVLLIAVCLIWAVFEFATGSPFWGVLFFGLGAIATWQFFLTEPPGEDDRNPEDP